MRARQVRGERLRPLELRAGPGPRAPARPAARRARRGGGDPRRQAPALLHHQRHPRHRRAVAGPGDPLRLQGLPLVGVLRRDALHAPRARRRRAHGQRAARRGPDRLRHLPGRHVQQHAVQRAALVHRRPGRQARRPRLGRAARRRRRAARRLPRRLRGGRARRRDPLVPGARQPRPLLDRVPARGRLPARDLHGRDDPRPRQRLRGSARAGQPRLLHGLPGRPHAARRHLRPRARSRTSRRRPRSSPPTPTAAP